jgi:hypothetical protein
MMREHVVETLQWDVAFASEHEAFDWQERLVSAMRGPAVEIINDVFDEVCGGAGGAREVLSLDTLTVDLGSLPRDGFEQQLRDRLRAGLRDALQQEIGSLRVQPASAARTAAPVRRAELLRHYLERGFLPWQAGAGTRRRLHELAERMARDHAPELEAWLQGAPDGARARLAALLRRQSGALGERLAALLQAGGPVDAAARQAWEQLLRWDAEGLLAQVRHHGQAARVRRHMARHFEAPMLLDLVGLLAPGERDFIAQVVGQPRFFGEATDPPVPPAVMRPRLWEFTLAHLLVERGSEFNRRSYIASLLRQNARQEGMGYAELVLSLMQGVEAAGLPSGLAREMLRLLQALADDAPAAAGVDAAEGAAGEPDTMEDAALAAWSAHKLRVESALVRDTALDAPLRDAWSGLVRDDGGWIVQQALRHGQSDRVRQRMARFEQAMLLGLVGLLVPTERTFVESVVGRAALFGEAMDPPVAARAMQPRLWEFTLAYLLVERGSEFNRRSYLAGVLRRSAAQSGMAYARLLRSLAERLRAAAPATGLQREMLQLLDALAQEAPAAHEDAPAAATARHAPGSRRWAELELPRLRFDWQAALAAGTLEAAAARTLWRVLARHDAPWLRETMLRQVQAQRARVRLAQELPAPLLADLAELLVAGSGAFAAAAVDHTARLAPPARVEGTRQRLWAFSLAWLAAERGSEFNKRSYMDSLLRGMARSEGLAHAELLRLLAAGLRALPAAGAIQRQMLRLVEALLEEGGREQAQAAPAAHAPAAGLEWLAGALQGGAVPPAEDAVAWMARIEAALPATTRTARTALEEALDTPQAAARLVGLLAPRLLARVLALLRPAEHAAALRSAALIADAGMAACAALGMGVPQARMRELQWQFLFEFLVVQGRPFAPADFARRMAAWLAARLRPADPARWRQALAREAARSPRSATQALGRAIAQAIEAPPAASARSASAAAARKPRRDGNAPQAREPEAGEPIYVANAGMVLAEPFLPRLFALRGLLQEDGKAFKDAGAAARGVHLLQYLVTGANTEEGVPEHELVLNKLLCGLQIADPLAWQGTLDAADVSTVDGLLQAIIQQWKVLGGTRPDGLRQTFLRREGRLAHDEERWTLLVEPGPFDMLVDQLPWGFSTLRFPWMERMIHVQWR